MAAKWLRAAAASVAIAVACTACGGSNDGPYEIEVSAQAEGAYLNVKGSSNLPDGALITVFILRNMKVVDGYEPQMTQVDGEGVVLKDGRFTFKADLERFSIYDHLAPDREVGEVSKAVTVCVQLRPNDKNESPQPDEVMDDIGEAGRNLKDSRQAKSLYASTWLETSISVPATTKELERLEPPARLLDHVGESTCPE
jgi:hypothetical protein